MYFILYKNNTITDNYFTLKEYQISGNHKLPVKVCETE